MQPTNKLRFIERVVEVHGDPKPVRILQQWWEDTEPTIIKKVMYKFGITKTLQIDGEWRDVPLETE